ncbi:MAG: P1 family peptidase [Anderseniella sp.]
MNMTPGPKNLITDIAGLKVGNAHNAHYSTGVTVLLPDDPVVAAADVRGGAPGTRDMSALDPACLVDAVHGIALSGGSVFGLDAAGGVISFLSEKGVGMKFGSSALRIPIVPSAILFDLTFGPDKGWGATPPYRELGIAAAEAAGTDFDLGNTGAGYGATAGQLKGGLGSASCVFGGFTVGSLVALNPVGSCINPASNDLWARPFELGGEFRPVPAAPAVPVPLTPLGDSKLNARTAGANTTIAVVATDAVLTKAEAQRLAIMASDGMARAIRPIHTPYDGDTVFALATGKTALGDQPAEALAMLGSVAADCLSRAIGRAMTSAQPLHGHDAWGSA